MLRSIAAALDVPSEALVLLALPTNGGLRSEDERTGDLVESIRTLARAEEALRMKLFRDGQSSEFA